MRESLVIIKSRFSENEQHLKSCKVGPIRNGKSLQTF